MGTSFRKNFTFSTTISDYRKTETDILLTLQCSSNAYRGLINEEVAFLEFISWKINKKSSGLNMAKVHQFEDIRQQQDVLPDFL